MLPLLDWFHAPMYAEINGTTLSVADEKKAATLPLASIQGVKGWAASA